MRKATTAEFLLVSVVAYRRRPMTWASELTVKVPCHSATVDRKKPTTRPLQPATRKLVAARRTPPTQLNRSMSRSSGKRARSLTALRSVAVWRSDMIHPMWLCQKPMSGLWMSSAVSLKRWWAR